MSIYYCHRCAAELGMMNPMVPHNLTATQYQLEKFIKHTAPMGTYKINSVFNDPSAYNNYVVYTAGSGCLQIDDRNRINLIWVAGRNIGATFIDGNFTFPDDSIKVVYHNDEWKIHAFPTLSDPIETKRCLNCGCLVVY